MARIERITTVSVEVTSQEKTFGLATVHWIDARGNEGSTSGWTDNGHMGALLDRAQREGVTVRRTLHLH